MGANGEPFDLCRMVGREAAEFRLQRIRAGDAPATVNRALVFLAEYARWASSRGVRPALADELAAIPRVPQQGLAPRGLAKPELRRYLKEVDVRANVRDRALVYTMLFTGLRLSEAAGVELRDIALTERKGVIRLRPEVAKGGKQRDVPVPALARKVLADYLAARGPEPGRLFLGERGPIGRNGIARAIEKYAHAARVELSPHRLRHAFAYQFLESTGNDLVGLADVLGHSNLNTTRVYTRRQLADLEAAVEKLDFAL